MSSGQVFLIFSREPIFGLPKSKKRRKFIIDHKSSSLVGVHKFIQSPFYSNKPRYCWIIIDWLGKSRSSWTVILVFFLEEKSCRRISKGTRTCWTFHSQHQTRLFFSAPSCHLIWITKRWGGRLFNKNSDDGSLCIRSAITLHVYKPNRGGEGWFYYLPTYSCSHSSILTIGHNRIERDIRF